MKIITIDFETFWSVTHSLSKMPAPNYVMHEDTELQSIAVKHGGDDTFVLFGETDIQGWADDTDFSDVFLLGHNMSGFDCMIAAWRLGINPQAWGCTLAMAAPIHAKVAGGSLRALSKHYNLKAKGDINAVNTKGKYLKDFTPREIDKMRVYNRDDADICYDLFHELAPQTSQRELRLIDATIRMTTEVRFNLDMELLKHTLDLERERKGRCIMALGNHIDPDRFMEADAIELTKKDVSSPVKFRALLERFDVAVPMKPSPANPEKMIPALAKVDEGFKELLEHENEIIATAASVRLEVKSTLLETRLQRFIDIGELMNGRMPIFLKYCGADTTWRWSGTQKLNQQNLPRINPKNPQLSDALRKCLLAPEGYKIVGIDLSGIEMRVNHFLWQVESSMDLYKNDPDNADLYVDFAANHMFHVKPEDVTDDQRFVGKVSHLSLGFGAGAKTFQAFARNYGKTFELDYAQKIVNTWRNAYPRIVVGWRTCHNALPFIAAGEVGKKLDPWGMCTTVKNGIKTPYGQIRYPNLRQELLEQADGTKRFEWIYDNRAKRPRIYAGKVDENLVQHLAREVLSDMWLDYLRTDIGKHYGVAHTVHDELIFVVKEADAQEVLDTMTAIMSGGVKWWPELITGAAGAIGDNYGDTH